MKTLLRLPLLRLLAINLAIGITAAVVMIGGLMWLNPHHLRDLILADRAGGAAFGLLLFGLVVTFGSVAMGTAIMALGRPKDSEPRGGKPIALPATIPARAR
ncbi:hypothetical protein [Undibacter mobilis]|uniref:Uncharacterized protein n=1 Tax=Undibacter mobilis TaxID=2292256 RepID=A0A371BAL3_9BRAD|nr:hypothetical protein [Undibacter mobilis]RDV04649.1 hypothetical protein DXH78_08790 [Undibacter mobilis]